MGPARRRSGRVFPALRAPSGPPVLSARLDDSDVAWDLRSEAPALLEGLEAAGVGGRGILRELRRSFPAARSCATFQWGPYLRPFGHFRAFYKRLPGGGVIGFKGADLSARDLPQMLEELKRLRGGSGTNLLDFLVRSEKKVPMAMTIEEALEEARAAARFQSAYLERYGELARIPVPLLVRRWGPSRTGSLRKALLAALDPAEGALVSPRLGELGALAYYYPNLPLRVRHLAQVSHSGRRESEAVFSRRRRLLAAALGDWPKPAETISRWLALTARILALGFSPCRAARRHGGHCVQEQNAVVDGGFADPDSLTPLAGPEAGAQALRMTLRLLSATIERYTSGYSRRARRAPAAAAVRRRLARLMAAERRGGLRVDPAVLKTLRGRTAVEHLTPDHPQLIEEQSLPRRQAGKRKR